jgi:hypothetical protein
METNLCQSDAKLYKYYLTNEVALFRERIHRKYPTTADAKIEQVVYTCVTDSIRDIVLGIVGKMTTSLSPVGDLVITGGEAFNMYFDKEDRIITSDIDTKFIPVFKGPSGQLISTKSPRYFGFLQGVKLHMWNMLGEIAKAENARIKKRVEDTLKGTKIGAFLGISLPTQGPWVTRRYTLIQKKRRDLTQNTAQKEDVLIDVELFALDLKIRYYSVEQGKIVTRNLGGILDIAIMRPFEVGYEVAFTRNHGIMYYDKERRTMVTNRNILFAGKRFLMEDVYLMQELGLRPQKAAKDKKRMLTFAKNVLGLKKLSASDSIETIFKKCIKKLPDTTRPHIKKRPVFRLSYNTNATNFAAYTTPPKNTKLHQLIGIRAPHSLNIPGFKRTSGQFRFNLNKKKWVVNTNPQYIKNENTHRASENFTKKMPPLKLKNILYGYNPVRNAWMPVNLVEKAAMIPLVGLKNMSFISKEK